MSSEPQASSFKMRGFIVLIIAGLGVVGLIAANRLSAKREADARRNDLAAGPLVRLHTVSMSDPTRNLNLQGEALPYASATLFAKISGYLRRIDVDKGDRVRAGQVIAVIDSQEIERDYQSLSADAQNKAENARRSEALFQDKLISSQEVERSQADAKIAEAKLASQAAQRGYQVVKAPFSGVITARFADPGSLVQSAANSQTSALPLATVAQIEKLRVNIYVDQRYASLIKLKDTVTVSPTDRPELRMQAFVTRTSGALDPRTRMLLTEIELDNRDGQILPGSFVQVNLNLKAIPRLEIPAEALLLRDGKSFVATVDGSSHLHFQAVQLGEEENQKLRVVSGLRVGDRVVLNLGDSAKEGDPVRVAPTEKR
jgi:membrane fusion protein, multidrug efflux system